MIDKHICILPEKEPKWSLHIRFADDSNPVLYRGISAEELAKQLSEWNENYKLWPDIADDLRVSKGFVLVIAERRDASDRFSRGMNTALNERRS